MLASCSFRIASCAIVFALLSCLLNSGNVSAQVLIEGNVQKIVPPTSSVPIKSSIEANTYSNSSGSRPANSSNSTTIASRSDASNAAALQELIDMQGRVAIAVEKAIPCVVSVEGGSGVIVSAQGDILTASHVTKKAGRTVNVRMADGRVISATTLGTNFNSDTAALRLNSPGPWPYVSLADSTRTEVGDWCIALGYPLSFKRGQPAAVRLGRILELADEKFVSDCPIMGGDSGGPLLNLSGNLIAISSRVKSDIKQNLHVPVRVYQDEWKQLAASIDVKTQAKPKRKRAYFGIQGETDFNRVRIRGVHRGSPAETAGIKTDDVLLQLDGKPIGTFDDVLTILDTSQPGKRVIAKLNRYGQLLNLSVKLGSPN